VLAPALGEPAIVHSCKAAAVVAVQLCLLLLLLLLQLLGWRALAVLHCTVRADRGATG
jgi:hypothetical protein